jgi:hypothetical protein
VDRVHCVWLIERQLVRVAGAFHPSIRRAEMALRAITELAIPTRRQYFKR